MELMKLEMFISLVLEIQYSSKYSENLEFLKEKIGKEGVKIVVADGGFEIKKNDKDEVLFFIHSVL